MSSKPAKSKSLPRRRKPIPEPERSGEVDPTITSLRGIQQASELKNVQKKLGCSRTSLGSLSEASRIFDSHRLKEMIAELSEQGRAIPGRFEWGQIDNKTITLVDGSLVSAMPSIIQASLLKASSGSGLVKWRLHTHFEVDRYMPTRIDVTPDGGSSNSSWAAITCSATIKTESRSRPTARSLRAF